MPYTYCEQIGKEIRDISDEIPFEIPDSWEWVRFSNIVNFSMGKTPPRKETEYWENPIYPWVSIADMPADGTVLSTKEKVNQYAADNTFKSGISTIGTLIMSFKLTVGKVSILGIDAYHNEAIISIFPFVDDDRIVTSYLFKVLPLIAQNGDTKTAIKGATLNSDSLSNLLIPLPSLTEQKRIVNRIVELEPYVSAYDIAETQLTTLNTTFPEALKKSILQEAVQGKLVPQDPNDEPASVLLQRIRAGKQALIKAGKIKRDKHESVIVTRDKIPYEIIDGKERCIVDEVPFEIPDSWCWCKMGICLDVRDGTHDTPKYVPKGIPLVTSKNLCNGSIDFSTAKFISLEDHEAISQCSKVDTDDIMFAMIGSIGNPVLYHGNEVFSIKNMALFKKIENGMDMEYVYWFLYISQSDMKKYASGGVQSFVSLSYLRNYYIPIPPIAEQKRIVVKIEELMQYCDKL